MTGFSSVVFALFTLLCLPAGAAFAAPQCEGLRYRGNFRLNEAFQQLARAEGARNASDRERSLGTSVRMLSEAARAGGSDEFTLWFLLARAYAMQGDLTGADSSFTRATRTAPDSACAAEVTRRRHNEWVPFQNRAVERTQALDYDSALALFRRSLSIYRDDPVTYLNMATVFVRTNARDSAVAYYLRASRTGSDARQEEMRATAAFNAARLLQRSGDLASAESLYVRYLRVQPRDAMARAGLASVLLLRGRTAEAAAAYDLSPDDAGGLESFDLFETGVSLLRQQRLAEAVTAFELGMRRNPHFRDALYNLSHAFLAQGDTARLLRTAHRLVAGDPMNRESWRMLAAAYQLRAGPAPTARAYRDSTLLALMRADSLPYEVRVPRFEPWGDRVVLHGVVENLRPRAMAEFVVTLELLNGAGSAVARERVRVPALDAAGGPRARHEFTVTVSGRGLLAYSYSAN